MAKSTNIATRAFDSPCRRRLGLRSPGIIPAAVLPPHTTTILPDLIQNKHQIHRSGLKSSSNKEKESRQGGFLPELARKRPMWPDIRDPPLPEHGIGSPVVSLITTANTNTTTPSCRRRNERKKKRTSTAGREKEIRRASSAASGGTPNHRRLLHGLVPATSTTI
jgi:hypothetical protein